MGKARAADPEAVRFARSGKDRRGEDRKGKERRLGCGVGPAGASERNGLTYAWPWHAHVCMHRPCRHANAKCMHRSRAGKARSEFVIESLGQEGLGLLVGLAAGQKRKRALVDAHVASQVTASVNSKRSSPGRAASAIERTGRPRPRPRPRPGSWLRSCVRIGPKELQWDVDRTAIYS